MNSLEATGRVIEVLEELAIPYILVGAFSSNAYGIPRNTKDADFVVSLRSGDLGRISQKLGGDFKFDRQLRMETITGSVRNVMTYLPTGWDIEFFRLSADEHHAERFRRRCRQRIAEIDREAWIPSAEDVVIQKVRWARRKDLDDVESILAVSGSLLDWDYLIYWTTQHGTQRLLEELRAALPDDRALEEE
ncbi:MAG: DUF6036 family nucleotidyltransferase [Planctomycetaceae bacterium]